MFQFMKNEQHQFYEITREEIRTAEERLGFSFPSELSTFYLEVGYGFINKENKNTFNRLLDPDTIADITLREGIYEFDPDLDGIYEEEDQFVFYEVNEGVYLTLDRKAVNQSPVYFFETKIAGSLEEFMQKIDQDSDYYREFE